LACVPRDFPSGQEKSWQEFLNDQETGSTVGVVIVLRNSVRIRATVWGGKKTSFKAEPIDDDDRVGIDNRWVER
jgi:hypothetical protein